MEIRTYGVEGYMDWQCEIPVGRARAIVHFTGGTMTTYGITPAEFSTGDPVKQRIIESSLHFKSGRIKLIRKTGTPDPVKPRAPKPAPAKEAPKVEPVPATPAPAKEAPRAVEIEDSCGEAESEVEEVLTEDAVEPAGEGAPQEVKVSCLTDAQNYLRDNFGIPTSKSRSKEKAQAFARENGIVFTGL